MLRHAGQKGKCLSAALAKRSFRNSSNIRNTESHHHGATSQHELERAIDELASRPLRPLTLAGLVKHGRPPLSPPSLAKFANFVLTTLPSRLAHRIRSLRKLPHIVFTNPNIAHIHDTYLNSFATLAPFAAQKISTVEEEVRFTEALERVVQNHTNTIPILARGFLDSKRYISRETVTKFLDEHLRARIGTRLIAEQHIALHNESQPAQPQSGAPDSSFIGVIDTALQPARIIRECASDVGEICEYKYGVRPSVLIDGDPGTQIAHVPVHLSYIVTELLKNAFRASIEKGHERIPVQVTIAPTPADSPPAPATASEEQKERERSLTVQDQGMPESAPASIKLLEKATPGVTIRFRDQGGGIPAKDFKSIWEYSFTTFREHGGEQDSGSGSDGLNVIAQASVGGSSIAGLGYGLPLSKAYAEFFGGGIAVHSMFGWGTDVYLTLRGVGKID